MAARMTLDERLLEAVAESRLQEVERLLSQGANPNAQQAGRSALDLVPYRQHLIRCALIEAGANDPEPNLVWAAGTGRPETVRRLIAAGADLNSKSYSGTPLEVAAAHGSVEIVQLLWEAGADPEPNPLAQALAHKRPEVALYLLQQGVPALGLQEAAWHGMTEVVQRLLARGLALDGVCDQLRDLDLRRFTALHAACRGGHWPVVELLLKAGADVHAREGAGRDALEVATPEVREQMIRLGITSRRTPAQSLLAAAEEGDLEAARAALAAGAPVDCQDQRLGKSGRTPLALACAAGHPALVEELLRAGAEVDRPDTLSANPRLKKMVRWAGRKVLAEEPAGRGPIFWAACNIQPECLRLLLGAGARAEVADALGLTPLDLACEAGAAGSVALLLRAGAKGGGAQLLRALENKQLACARALLDGGVKPTQKAFERAAALAEPDLLRALWGPKSKFKAGPALVAVTEATREVPPAEAPAGNWTKVNGKALIPQPEERILECVEFMLERQADVETVGTLGTPLMNAARQGLARVVRRLLQAGSNPGRIFGGDTALSLARLYQRSEVVAILEAAGAAEAPQRVQVPAREPGPAAEVPVLQATPAFLEAVAELEEICGSKAIAKAYLGGGVEIHVHSQKRQGVDTLLLQRAYAPRGAFVFEPTSRDGPLAVLPAKDWVAALAVMQTNGANCGLSSGDVLNWMLELQNTQPFELRVIGRDVLSGSFLGPVVEPGCLARKMYEFCPDIVDQGCGSVKALERELAKSPASLFFWWD
ncbi:MAG: ankyrin repeat domain-containing protein [Vulcanimicrobiota bacterium]